MADAENEAEFLKKLRQPPASEVTTNAPVATAIDPGEANFIKRLQSTSPFTMEASRGDIATRSNIDPSSIPDATTFKQRYERPGRPLDTSTGAPWQTRLKLSFAPDDNTRVAMLQQSFKGAEIEPVEDNQFIIRNVADAQGKTIDLLVDERRTSAKDWLDLASLVPEMAGAYAALRGGRGRLERLPTGFGRLAAEAGLGASGGQLLGGTADALARIQAGQPMNLEEISERREKQAAGETITGFGLGSLPVAVSGTARRLTAPRTLVQEQGLDARARLERATRLPVRMSFGTETGSPNALRAEAIAGKTPTGGAFIKAQSQATDEDMREIQRFLQGDAPYPVSDASQRAVSTLRQIAEDTTQSVDRQTQAVASRAANDLASSIAAETGIGRSVLKDEAGNAIQDAVVKHKGAFDVGAEEMAAAIGSDPPIPIKPIRKTLDAIKAELTKGTKKVGEQELLTGFDEFGPISTSVDIQGREVLREFIPEGMDKFLTGLGKLDPETPLNELRALRTRINDAKRQSEIIPGVSTRLLSKFSGAITEAIEAAEHTIPDPGVVQRLKAFNQYYREGMEKFDPKGVIELLSDPDQLKLGPYAIVNQAARDPDQFFRIKKALTEPIKRPDGTIDSPANVGAWNLFRRAVLTDIEDQARLAGTGTLASGKKFLDVLFGYESKVIDELLGLKAYDVIKNARTLGVIEGRLNIDDTIKLLKSNDPSIGGLKALEKAQDKADKLYRENVIKKFVKGEIDSTAIDDGEFVDRFISVARDADEVSRVMSRLSGDPALVKSIKSHTVRNFFQEAAQSPSMEDIARRMADDPTVMVDPKRMLKQIDKDESKLRAVLGNDSVNMLRDYLSVEAMRGVREQAAQAVGGLVGGSLMSSIMTLDFKRVPAHIKYAVVGRLISDPELLSKLKTASRVDPHIAAQQLIVSAPFIEGIMEDFGKGPGSSVLRILGNAVGLGNRQVGQGEPPQ